MKNLPITSKLQFVDLYIKGVLGNRFEVWTDWRLVPPQFISVGFRELSKGGGKFEMCDYDRIPEVGLQWEREGRKYYVNAGDYDIQRKATIQGEIAYFVDGWYIYVGPANVYKMRDMFKKGLAIEYKGLVALQMLRKYLCPSSLDDVKTLLEMYPDHIIEFTAYSINVGRIPNRNTIIWEVRKY